MSYNIKKNTIPHYFVRCVYAKCDTDLLWWMWFWKMKVGQGLLVWKCVSAGRIVQRRGEEKEKSSAKMKHWEGRNWVDSSRNLNWSLRSTFQFNLVLVCQNRRELSWLDGPIMHFKLVETEEEDEKISLTLCHSARQITQWYGGPHSSWAAWHEGTVAGARGSPCSSSQHKLAALVSGQISTTLDSIQATIARAH